MENQFDFCDFINEDILEEFLEMNFNDFVSQESGFPDSDGKPKLPMTCSGNKWSLLKYFNS